MVLYNAYMDSNEYSSAENIAHAIIKLFGNRLDCILQYGSTLQDKEPFDLDMLIVLHDKNSMDTDRENLRLIVQQHNTITLDLQLMYADEIDSPEYFSLDAHGAFFVHILKSAKTLYGTNPFLKRNPTERAEKMSLAQRIQRYLFQARHEFIHESRSVKDKNPNYHRKHVHRTLVDLILLIEGNYNDDNIIERLSKHATNDEYVIIENALISDTVSIDSYIAAYEVLYSIALKYTHDVIPASNDTRISRSLHEDIAFEYIRNASDTAVILLDGIPRVPELSDTMRMIASHKYDVFFPRLKGSWESTGTFFESDPSKDIASFARALKDGLRIDNELCTYTRVAVVSSSFGGMISLRVGLEPAVDSVIAFSPVYDFAEVPHVDTLGMYIKTAFPGAYRGSIESFEKLLADPTMKFKEIMKDQNFNPAKYTIIGGISDPQIDYNTLKELSAHAGVRFETLPIGHISLHKDIGIVRPTILRFLNG